MDLSRHASPNLLAQYLVKALSACGMSDMVNQPLAGSIAVHVTLNAIAIEIAR